MDRRKSLKLIATGAIASPLALESCKTTTETKEKNSESVFNLDRSPDELLLEKKILEQGKYFTPHFHVTILDPKTTSPHNTIHINNPLAIIVSVVTTNLTLLALLPTLITSFCYVS